MSKQKRRISSVMLPNATADVEDTRLPDGYQPQPFDVICKGDRVSVAHTGNQAFSHCVESRVDRYMAAKTRFEKTKIIKEIIGAVSENGGRFILQKRLQKGSSLPGGGRNQEDAGEVTCVYFEVSGRRAADKVGHAIRLAVSKREPDIIRRRSWPVPENALQNVSKEAEVWKARHDQGGQQVCTLAIAAIATNHNKSDQGSKIARQTRQDINVATTARSGIDFCRRRQSWHAGFTSEDRSRSPPKGMYQYEPESDISLSSQEWDLGELQAVHDEKEDDVLSVDSIWSKDFAISARPMQAIDVLGLPPDDDCYGFLTLDDDKLWEGELVKE